MVTEDGLKHRMYKIIININSIIVLCFTDPFRSQTLQMIHLFKDVPEH
jgi:hypothetical protein